MKEGPEGEVEGGAGQDGGKRGYEGGEGIVDVEAMGCKGGGRTTDMVVVVVVVVVGVLRVVGVVERDLCGEGGEEVRRSCGDEV